VLGFFHVNFEEDQNKQMSSISIYFQPIQQELVAELHKESLGQKIDIHSEEGFPDWEDSDVVLFGVQEDRASDSNMGASGAPNEVRAHLYKLYLGGDLKISDLGNIYQGASISDTYKAVEDVIFEVIKKNKIILFLGGSRDLGFAAYKAYGKLEQTVNVCSIDPRLNMGEYSSEVSPSNYINHIILHQPNYLFNYSSIGYQTYLVPPSEIELMNDLYFDHHRLGLIQEDVKRAEPIMRYADLVTVNINAIRFSEIGLERADASPNGFYGEEICQIMRYAGISDKVSCAGLFDYNPIYNETKFGAKLVAQMMWCFMEGVSHRKRDFPIGDKSAYKKYLVPIEGSDHQVNFYKSDKSSRWWMEVPYPPDQRIKFERHHMIPCTYEDYEQASKGVVPDLWYRTYQKLR
jgi:formiminoglutamase